MASVHEEVEGACREAAAEGIPVHIHTWCLNQAPLSSIVECDHRPNINVGLGWVGPDVLIGNNCAVHTIDLEKGVR